MKEPILVWSFCEAPEKYQALSNHGGDEDWLAFIPAEYRDAYIPWMDSGTGFGSYDVSSHEVEGGVVRIGAHA